LILLSANAADQARRALDRLIEVQPAWRTDARALLAKSIYDAAAVDRLMRDLAAAALPGASRGAGNHRRFPP
jgi:hypothetical protein